MALEIGNFTNLQEISGRVLVSGEGQKAGTSVQGKLANWLQSVFRPGTIAQDNRAAMNAFVGAISLAHGPGMARVATHQLQKDLDAGLPLTGAKIKSTLEKVSQEAQRSNAEMNSALIGRMTRFDPADPFNTLGKIISAKANEMGLAGSVGLIDTPSMLNNIKAALLKARDGDSKLLSQPQAQMLTKACVRFSLLAATAAPVPWPPDGPKFTAMMRFMQEHPIKDETQLDGLFSMVNTLSVKSDTDLSAINGLVKAADSFFNKAGAGFVPRHVLLGESLRLITSIGKATESVATENVGVDDLNRTLESMVAIWTGSGRVPPAKVANCFQQMNSEPMKQLFGSATLVYDPQVAQTLERQGGGQAVTLSRIFAVGTALMHNLGLKTGQSQEDLEEIVLNLPQPQSAKDLNIDTLHALSCAGVSLPYGSKNLSGDFGQAFEADFQAMLSSQAMQGTFNAQGVDTTCRKDMGRSTFVLNDSTITRPGASERSLNNAEQALAKAIPDLKTRQIVTALAHQGALANVLQAQFLDDQAPFQAMLSGIPGATSLRFSISTRDPNQITLDVSYQTRFNQMINDTGQSAVNPESRSSIAFSLGINRAMAADGIAQITIERPVAYEADFRQ